MSKSSSTIGIVLDTRTGTQPTSLAISTKQPQGLLTAELIQGLFEQRGTNAPGAQGRHKTPGGTQLNLCSPECTQ